MRTSLRDPVRVPYSFRCGYCGITETDAGSLLTVDHFQPRSQGGSDQIENLVYCCHACNEFKGDYWDPESVRRILHPLREDLSAHLSEMDDARLSGQTETGQFHLDRLQLNRSELVANRLRRRRVRNARLLQQRLIERLRELEGDVQNLYEEILRLDE